MSQNVHPGAGALDPPCPGGIHIIFSCSSFFLPPFQWLALHLGPHSKDSQDLLFIACCHLILSNP